VRQRGLGVRRRATQGRNRAHEAGSSLRDWTTRSPGSPRAGGKTPVQARDALSGARQSTTAQSSRRHRTAGSWRCSVRYKGGSNVLMIKPTFRCVLRCSSSRFIAVQTRSNMPSDLRSELCRPVVNGL
jgi:hypothetical protein